MKEIMEAGFLPFSRASFSLNVIVLILAIALPLLSYSIFAVRQRYAYTLHKRLQMILSVALGIAVVVFELEIRLNGWRHLAESSPYYATWVFPALVLHLLFALPALVLWFLTVFFALKKFPVPPKPGEYSARHKRLAWWSTYAMYGTAITGWVFYWLAFVS